MSRISGHKFILGIVIGLLLMGIAACGGSDEDEETPNVEPTPVAWQVVSNPITQANAHNIRLTGRLDGHGSTVFHMSFSRDGRYLATISAGDNRAIIWDTTTGEVVNTVGTSSPKWIFFSPSADYFYIIDGNQDISQWSMETGNPTTVSTEAGDETLLLRAQTQSALIGSIAFGQNGNLVATAGQTGQVYVLSLEPFETVAEINGHPVVPIYSIAITTDGTRLASLGGDDLVRVWDIATNEMLYEFQGLSNPKKVLFSPDATQLAIITDTAIQLYNTDDWSLVGNILIVPNSTDADAAYSSDGSKIITYGRSASVFVWDLAQRALWVELPNHLGGVKAALMSDDQTLMVSVSVTGDIFLWDLSSVDSATDTNIDVRRGALPIPTDVDVHDVLWSPDRRLIAVADRPSRVLILGVVEE